jgi:hypothetical protein
MPISMTDQDSVAQTAAHFFASFLGDTSLEEALTDGRAFAYAPRKDITAYELALCLHLVGTKVSSSCALRDEQKVYDQLPPSVQRHFAVVPLESTDA